MNRERLSGRETLYLTQRRFGDTKKLEILSRIHQLGFKLLSVTDALVFQAAEYKAQFAMSYADCFALACDRILEGWHEHCGKNTGSEN